ncbi:Phosphoribosylglycinamide formyltransferase [termite gut metagenome]|uniref:phosphoribosylglycinamide formyltransferase 1 n=1 Tax=termite gut metagenome TaxID=433724 RepID=A0A5J4SWN9_9ZZZZ
MRFARFIYLCAYFMFMRKYIAILASGSGSNAENIITYFEKNSRIKIALVLSNKENAGVLERAQRLGVPSVVVPKDDWVTGEKAMILLRQYRIDFIVLAGFLLQIPEIWLHAYPHKIINIHPALLPKFGGKGMYGNKVHEAVVAANEKESGITIHYVNEHYDKGEIIFQTKCEILPKDFPEDVAKKVHALEYTYFPKIIEQVVSNYTL